MLGEAAESVRLIGQFLDAGTAAGTAELPVHGQGETGRAPASAGPSHPRGEALAWVQLDDAGRISRARLRPASARNWRGFDDACRSQNVFTDIPIIEASFWLTAAGMARLKEVGAMPLWFVRGLRRGVVTTRYPAAARGSAAFLPTPPAFRPRR